MGLSPEPGKQPSCWSITPDGLIRYTASPDLLLEVKGEAKTTNMGFHSCRYERI
jgi:hypothetical protein